MLSTNEMFLSEQKCLNILMSLSHWDILLAEVYQRSVRSVGAFREFLMDSEFTHELQEGVIQDSNKISFFILKKILY